MSTLETVGMMSALAGLVIMMAKTIPLSNQIDMKYNEMQSIPPHLTWMSFYGSPDMEVNNPMNRTYRHDSILMDEYPARMGVPRTMYSIPGTGKVMPAHSSYTYHIWRGI
jgi:hypothetical protein